MIELTEDQWNARGQELFGLDHLKWRFKCPICGHVAAVEDFKPFADKGATPNSATNECIGRYTKGVDALSEKTAQPCNYAGYGLLRLSPVLVKRPDGSEVHCFAFDETPQESGNRASL